MRRSATLQPGAVLQKLCSQQQQVCGEFINTHSISVFNRIVGLVDAVALAGKTDDVYTQEQAVYKICLLVLGLKDEQPEIARIQFNYVWEDVCLRARPIRELTQAVMRDLPEAREDLWLSIPSFVRPPPPVRGKRVRRPKELSSSLQGADAQCALDLERERRHRRKKAQPIPAEDRLTGKTIRDVTDYNGMPEPELAAD